jgi:hypothetical protein
MIFSTIKTSNNKTTNTEIQYIPTNNNTNVTRTILSGNMIDRIKGTTKCDSCGGK